MAVSAADAPPPADVTTTTDVWFDRTGSYRILETNDRDGGREVVRHGRDLYVALRYGKMIRRIAEDPEPERLLLEALGGPSAAWDLAAPVAAIAHRGTQEVAGAQSQEYVVTRSDRPDEPGERELPALQSWRRTVQVRQLDGQFWIDDKTGTAMRALLAVGFSAQAGDRPLSGRMDVQAAVDGIGTTEPITAPPGAEELARRQRLVPEQKELLSGLGALAPAPAEKGRRP